MKDVAHPELPRLTVTERTALARLGVTFREPVASQEALNTRLRELTPARLLGAFEDLYEPTNGAAGILPLQPEEKILELRTNVSFTAI
ncbi:MAG: hypothetical protein ACE5FG_15940 [Myxococcota bacterium]